MKYAVISSQPGALQNDHLTIPTNIRKRYILTVERKTGLIETQFKCCIYMNEKQLSDDFLQKNGENNTLWSDSATVKVIMC